MSVYYNEWDKFAAKWLRNLGKAGEISGGIVDERSIREVRGSDLAGVRRAHFFAGIGGWDLALRLAGWPDDWTVWTGSCPCQPFSAAGKEEGFDDPRHLWPEFKRLIGECRPSVVFGEQVARAKLWMDQVCDDFEEMGYAVGTAILPAYSVGLDHQRDRIFFVAYADGKRLEGLHQKGRGINLQPATEDLSRFNRKATPGVLMRADGFSRKLAKPSFYKQQVIGFGNAICPPLAAEFIRAAEEAIKDLAEQP